MTTIPGSSGTSTSPTPVTAAPSSKRLDFERLGLYGRDQEVKVLKSAFQKIVKFHATPRLTKSSTVPSPVQVVWIEGASGSGKSTLAQELRQPAREARCFFVEGKFDLPHQVVSSLGRHSSHSSNKNLTNDAVTVLTSSSHRNSTSGTNQTKGGSGNIHREPSRTQQTLLYQGIRQALGRLCDQILALPRRNSNYDDNDSDNNISNDAATSRAPCFFEDAQEQLVKSLKGSFDVLDLIIPSLSDIIREGGGSVTETLSSSSTHTNRKGDKNVKELADRLRYACRRFIQVVSRFAPIVIVLDDLQWAGQPSLDLLFQWMTDSQSGALMIVGCYRQEEVTKDHPLLKMISNVESRQNKSDSINSTRKIILQDLGISEIEDLLETLFETSDPGSTLDLADIVHQKTGGNSFYVVEFIQLLAKKNLIYYNVVSQLWEWDEEEIHLQTQATENIAHLMKELLHQSDVARNLLPVAACLGSSFTADSLFRVVQHLTTMDPQFQSNLQRSFLASPRLTPQQGGSNRFEFPQDLAAMEKQLNACKSDGFLDVISGDTYCFIHDQVQEAALKLIKGDRVADLEFQIGEAVLATCNPDELHELLFAVLDMLNPKAVALKATDPKRIQISKLNQEAAVMAMKAASFATASWFFRRAISLLPRNRWDCHYSRTLEMYTSAAVAEAIQGNLEAMIKYAETVQSNAKDIHDKVQVYHIMMDSFMEANRAQDSVDIGLSLLEQFNVKFPKNDIMLTGCMVSGLVRAKSIVASNIDVDSNDLMIAKDKDTLAISKTLDKLVTASFFTKQQLMSASIFKGVRMIFKNGATKYSPVFFALFGFAMTCHLNDLELGKKCADRALELQAKCKGKDLAARVAFVTHGMILSHISPMHTVLNPLYEGYNLGVKTGNFENAVACGLYYVLALFECGKSLTIIEQYCATFAKLGEDFGTYKFAELITCVWQSLRNLMGDEGHTSIITGSKMKQEVFEEANKERTKDPPLLRRFQMTNALFFGEHEFGANMALEKGDDALKISRGLPGSEGFRFVQALSCYHMVQHHGDRRKYLSHGKKAHKQVSEWAEMGNPNCRHFAALLNAELAIVRGENTISIIKHFDEAMAFATKDQLLRDQALIYERYALFWEKQDNFDEFQSRALAALNHYREWGAHAKVILLKNQWKGKLGASIEELPTEDTMNMDDSGSLSSVTTLSFS